MGNESSSMVIESPISHEGLDDEEKSDFDTNNLCGNNSVSRNYIDYEKLFHSNETNVTESQSLGDDENIACISIKVWLKRNKLGAFIEASDDCETPISNTSTHEKECIKLLGSKPSLGFHYCKSFYQHEKTGRENEFDSQEDLDNLQRRVNRNRNRNRRQQFPSSLPFFKDLEYTEEEILMDGGDIPSEESDLRPLEIKRFINGKEFKSVKCRSFHIITTAALPWMTGTAVNPLLRAAYLNQMNRTAVQERTGDVNSNFDLMGSVTLCIPWLIDELDRKILYGDDYHFTSSYEQEVYIRTWLRESAKLPLEASLETNGIKISFYDAKYSVDMKSVLSTGDIRELIGLEANDADICILEEPEHLNSTMPLHNVPFTETFKHVVGVIHTNYQMYAEKQHLSGPVIAPILARCLSNLTRIHCHKIIKLSDTLQIFAAEKECISNVHGIRSDFLDAGKRAASKNAETSSNKIYFIGKLLWAKGLDDMIALENAFKNKTGHYFDIDIIGSGPEEEEIQRAFHGRAKQPFSSYGSMTDLVNEMPKSRHEFRKDSIPATFLGRMDHALVASDYKIFVNPSVTEVLCTTTAEAVAMGKFVIIPRHPSNAFFEQFPNCLMYTHKSEFVSQLLFAQSNPPTPLSPEISYKLTWNAANERLIEASKISRREARRRLRVGQVKLDERSKVHVKRGVSYAVHSFLLGTIGMSPTNPNEDD